MMKMLCARQIGADCRQFEGGGGEGSLNPGKCFGRRYSQRLSSCQHSWKNTQILQQTHLCSWQNMYVLRRAQRGKLCPYREMGGAILFEPQEQDAESSFGNQLNK